MTLIFDLDDTLIDTTCLIVPQAAKKSCEALVGGGVQASLEQLLIRRKVLAVGLSHSKIFPNLPANLGSNQIQQSINKKKLSRKRSISFTIPKSPRPFLLSREHPRF